MLTVAELKKIIDEQCDDDTMEVQFLDCGGFIVSADDAYVEIDDDTGNNVLMISH